MLRSAVGAVLLCGLAACNPDAPSSTALQSNPAQGMISGRSAAGTVGSVAFPATVEEYWSGRGHCLEPADRIDDRAEASIKLIQRYSEPVTRRVGDVRFVQRPAVLVEALRELTSQMPAETLAKFASDCPTVHCAITRIFGNPQGLRLLYLMVRYRYNASHWADRHAVPWTGQELADILLALGDLPPAATPFYDQRLRSLVHEAQHERLKSLFPITSGEMVAISSSSDSVGIRTTYRWHLMPQHQRRAAMFHELAHDFLRQQRSIVDADAIWYKAMAADEVFREKTGRFSSTVSRYASESLDEDFAESVVAYRYAPELMKGRTPNRANLLKVWYFDGLSYDAPASCRFERGRSQIAAHNAIATLPSHRMSDKAVLAAVATCQKLLTDDQSRYRVTRGRLCIGREIFRDAMADELQALFELEGPLTRALVEGRQDNNPFLQMSFGAIGDARIMALTDRRALATCGGGCHSQEPAESRD